MLDLVVEGNAYLDGALNKCCVGIEHGKIVAIKKILQGDQHFDFGDKLLLPAGIDIHVHFRDPGFFDKEDFYSGSLSAAFGGISCVFDMPNTKPAVISKKTVLEKLKIVSKKSLIDFGLYSSISSRTNISATAKVCSAFKIYLASTTGDLLFSDKNALDYALRKINDKGRIPAIHAESESMIRAYKKRNPPAKNLHEHLRARPNDAEAQAVSNILEIMNHWELNNNIKSYKNQKLKEKPNLLKNEINNMTKSKDSSKSNDIQGLDISDISKPSSTMSTIPLNIGNSNKKHVHICHVSTSEGVSLLRGFLKSNSHEPVVLTSEVTPHHLLLNERFDGKAFGKVNPPLRRVEDQAALWSALADGIINIIASDHAPHTLEEKNYEFSLAPAGIPGVETMLPLMLSHVKHNRLPLEKVINAITSTPAALFQLPKGRLAKGYDGDLIVIDFYKENDIKVKNLHSKCEWTPYENMAAIFPLLTVVRGNIIVKDGNLEADPGFGKFFN